MEIDHFFFMIPDSIRKYHYWRGFKVGAIIGALLFVVCRMAGIIQ